jgi:hypothetical protein
LSNMNIGMFLGMVRFFIAMEHSKRTKLSSDSGIQSKSMYAFQFSFNNRR